MSALDRRAEIPESTRTVKRIRAALEAEGGRTGGGNSRSQQIGLSETDAAPAGGLK